MQKAIEILPTLLRRVSMSVLVAALLPLAARPHRDRTHTPGMDRAEAGLKMALQAAHCSKRVP